MAPLDSPLPLAERQRLLTTVYEQWPALAREWIRAGYDSPILQDFAALSPAEGASLADLMSDVLASLGVPVRVGQPLTNQPLSLLTDIEVRCSQALDIVASDATRTWGQLDLRLATSVDDHLPAVSITVTVGGHDQPDSDTTMLISMSDSELAAATANGVREALLVHFGVKWPVCVQHRARMIPTEQDINATVEQTQNAWWCPAERGHRVASIGELSAESVIPPDRSTLNLAPPAWW